jgi:biopolymer transport protein ExbB
MAMGAFEDMQEIENGFLFLIKGGFVMWPLFLCAILSVAVMIERGISIAKAGSAGEGLLEQVRELLTRNKADDALKLCEGTHGPIAALIAGALRHRTLDSDAIERSMEELALRETPQLYKRLGILDTIITIAPLLGLLGTVTGMIRSFHVVASTTGLNAPTAITGGVAEALIATATGLAIAIVTLVGYNYLTERVKEIIAEMEIRATQILNILVSLRGKEGRTGEVAASRA